MTSSSGWTQNLDGPSPSVRLKKGEPAPADGRWLREEYFLVWYRSYIALEQQVEVLRDEVEDGVRERAKLEAQLYGARVAQQNAELNMKIQAHALERMKKERDDRWTSGQVFRIAAGSVATTLLIGVIIALSVE